MQGGFKIETVTSSSNRAWLDRHSLKVERYLRRNHRKEDRPTVFELIFFNNPDEGRKLIQNFDLPESKKRTLAVQFAYHSPQITCGIMGDQRSGKDAWFGAFYDDTYLYCKGNNLVLPRVVTLGNIRKPPFVNEEDMYFSFKDIPAGSSKRDTWVYCSELEVVLPCREGTSPENKLFTHLEGVLAQNHIKLFGCIKLLAKVDISAIRSMNMKVWKFINPEKLSIEGVERANVLSPLGQWLIPKEFNEKSNTLLAFDNQLLTTRYPLPTWWTEEYSEQYRDIPMNRINDYIETAFSNGLSIQAIQTSVSQKFHKKVDKAHILELIGLEK